MAQRRLALAMLALAGVLVGHTAGYGMVHGAGVRGGHGYVLPALAVVGPVAVTLAAAAAVAEARRVGLALELSVVRLLGAQVAVYTVQEVGERLLHGDLGTIIEPGVALGLLAQLPAALVLYCLVRLARRAANRLFSASSACPSERIAQSSWPVTTDGSRTLWSPLSTRAPPSFV